AAPRARPPPPPTPTSLRAARSAALSTWEAAQAQLAEDAEAGASDVQLAADQTALVAARTALIEARQAVEDATLRASFGGTVTQVGIQRGDVLGGSATSAGSGGSTGGGATTSSASTTTSSTGISLATTDRFVLEATVPAADVGRLQDGLQVEITPSGVSDVVYGTVEDVARVASTDSAGAAVFAVTVEVTGRRDDLYAGTDAEASVIVSQTADVLTVSTPAVQSDDEGTYVDLVDGESVERVAVETGETYGMTTEVLAGLEEGDVVEVPGFSRPVGSGSGGEGQGQMPSFPGGGVGGEMPQPPTGGGFPGGGQ
ncbi:efflux RND transporter periplasmic adaptor subunit, partial [Nocardioides sp. R-C-SC26]|uniref:efflux RND transporter periplasmic adaptor subunit n=1 Tax=Nocardioides sp. R-C-SC26 TaxID=2870414 RepID=UPI001E2D55EF